MEAGDQQIHDAIVDEEGDSADKAEFHELSNQIFHIANLHGEIDK